MQQGASGSASGSINLTRGTVPIMIVGNPGNRKIDLNWRKPGDEKSGPIPASLMFYDVVLKEKIQRGQK